MSDQNELQCAVKIKNLDYFTGYETEKFIALSWSVDGDVLIFALPNGYRRVFNFRKVLGFETGKVESAEEMLSRLRTAAHVGRAVNDETRLGE